MSEQASESSGREYRGRRRYRPDPRKVFQYLTDEICVVIEIDNAVIVSERRKDLYVAVQEELNQRIRPLLPRPVGDGAAPNAERHVVDQDLRPSAIWKRCVVRDPGLFQEPKRGVQAVSFDDDAITKVLHVYTVGLDDRDASVPFALHHRAETARELAFLVNRQYAQREANDVERARGWRVRAASPHWLVDIASDERGPGPVAPPLAIAHPPAGGYRWKIGLTDPSPAAVPQPQQPSAGRVLVAVLDTSLTQDEFTTSAGKYPNNPMLKQLSGHPQASTSGSTHAKPLTIESLPVGAVDPHAHLDKMVANWPGAVQRAWHDALQSGDDAALARLREREYNMRDHGLFVAGIINAIAPYAEIHLFKAFSATGVCDWITLAKHLRDVPKALGMTDDDRLIVNLSATVNIPSGEEMLRVLFPKTSRGSAARQHWRDVPTLLAQIELVLTAATDWLKKHKVLVVAAVGNNAIGVRHRPEPQYPAYIDSVLGVAAVNGSDRASSYSNLGDEALAGVFNGVATFGGDATIDAHGWTTIKFKPDGSPDAVIGLCCQDPLPLGAGPNKTGYVAWSGTSFATPIITAIAANYWSGNMNATPPEIVAAIRDLANPLGSGSGIGVHVPALRVDAIHAEQVPVPSIPLTTP